MYLLLAHCYFVFVFYQMTINSSTIKALINPNSLFLSVITLHLVCIEKNHNTDEPVINVHSPSINDLE